MAAAQVAKKLKDRRQKHTLEEIFRKVLSLVITVHPLPMIYSERLTKMVQGPFLWGSISEYLKSTGLIWASQKQKGNFLFKFSKHVKVEIYGRVHKLVGPDGLLKKDEFIKILQSSNFFMKTFDKNQDGIVTEVHSCIPVISTMILNKDGNDDQSRIGFQSSWQRQQWIHHQQGDEKFKQ